MKKLFAVVILALVGSVLIWQFAFHATAQTTNENDQYQQAVKAQAARAQRAETLLSSQEAMHQQAESLMERQEKLIDRQEKDFDRFEKILGTWEKQQQQYQTYLDSLTKK
jgi:hypothetical protein